ERMESQFFDKTNQTFLGDTEANHQEKDSQAHGHGDIDVCGRYYLEIEMRVTSDPHGEFRYPVDRYQIHQVHQENPHKDRQRKWGNECTFVLKAFFYSFIDKFDDHLNEVEETGRYSSVGFFCCPAEQGDKDQTQTDGPSH